MGTVLPEYTLVEYKGDSRAEELNLTAGWLGACSCFLGPALPARSLLVAQTPDPAVPASNLTQLCTGRGKPLPTPLPEAATGERGGHGGEEGILSRTASHSAGVRKGAEKGTLEQDLA